MKHGFKAVSTAVIRLTFTGSGEDKQALIRDSALIGVRSVAVDYGGDYLACAKKSIVLAVASAGKHDAIKENPCKAPWRDRHAD